MSRLGKKPIEISKEVRIEFKNKILEVSGPGGKLSQAIDDKIDIKIDNNCIFVKALGYSRQHSMLHGLTRGLIANMVEGVMRGFKKKLEVVGLGYKANVESGENLVLAVGFSHLVTLSIPPTVKVSVVLTAGKNALITIAGIDKCEVGSFAAQIRAVKPPEPYKGFGIRYLGEKIARKTGKAVSGGTGKK
ncbi:MAG: 50S ribosomal protein L6 [Endomicrobium sp.]|jgi:large subunit ribosomal protein L6|nr:50S ribosomal protein L6 [Endomicrobium sp.]